jgi:hypothetical protein
VRLCKITITYGNNIGNDVSETDGSKADIKTTKAGCALVDCDTKLERNRIGAIVVVAVVELRKDIVTLAAEGGDGILDVCGGPLRNNLRDSAGEGHSTGSDDSEDGRETHGEEAGEGYLG